MKMDKEVRLRPKNRSTFYILIARWKSTETFECCLNELDGICLTRLGALWVTALVDTRFVFMVKGVGSIVS